MAINLISKIVPKNDGFLGLVDARQIIGDGATNVIPANALSGSFLFLDQTTPQTIINGRPISSNGIQLGLTPTVGSHSTGKIYWDTAIKTGALELEDTAILKLGQDSIIYIYNGTGSTITKGQAVYISGSQSGIPSVTLARADSDSTSSVAGIIFSSSILTANYGYIILRGNVDSIDTNAWTVGDSLYLSGSSAGSLTNVRPSSGNYDVSVGRVMIKNSSTGRIYIDIKSKYNLIDLSDVTITSPNADDVLKYNGTEWVNSVSSSSSGSTITDSSLFLDDTAIVSSGSQSSYSIKTLTDVPVTTSEVVSSITLSNNTVLYENYLYGTTLGRTSINAGIWQFSLYAGVSVVSSNTYLKVNINRVRPGTGTTTTNDVNPTTRSATVSSGTPFTVGSIDTGGTVDTDSYLETTSGLFRILTRVSDTEVTIEVPATYTNQSSVTYSVHKKLFQASTIDINNIATSPSFSGLQLYTITSIQGSFSVLVTDKISASFFGSSNGSATVYYSHNGTSRYSSFSTPLIDFHNEMAGLQGGTIDEYYHLTSTEYTGTGTGVFARKTSPSFITPTLGAASATSIAVPTITSASGAMTITPLGGNNLNIDLTTTGDFIVNTNQLYVDTSTVRVGIGTATPNNTIQVVDLINFDNNNLTTKLGYQAGEYLVTNATSNTFVGYQTGRSNSTLSTSDATDNTAVGYHSFYKNISGNFNTANGSYSLYSNTTGFNNVANGVYSLYLNTIGSSNTADGMETLYSNTTGIFNTASGNQTLYANISGSNNTAYGSLSLSSNITGSGNVTLGHFAGAYETGSNAFYVDNQDRTDTANEKIGALLYGTFNTAPASQTLTINATVTVAQNISAANLSGSNSGDQDLSGYEPVLGFTAENVANKDTNTALGSSNVYYPSQLAVKTYVDNQIGTITSGQIPKLSCRAATIVTGTIATDFENGDTVDTVVLATNDRILIKNQATASENGIYTVNASGAPTRATDYDTSGEVGAGTFTFIVEGSQQNTQWIQTTPTPTINVSDLIFSQVGAQQAFTASLGVQRVGADFRSDFVANDGLKITTNSLTIAYDNSSLGIVSNNLAIKTAGVTYQMLAGSIPDSKLDAISTAGKVSGAALTSLSSIPSVAGIIPVANLGTGTPDGTKYLRDDGAFAVPAGSGGSISVAVMDVDFLSASRVNTTDQTTQWASMPILVKEIFSAGVGGTTDPTAAQQRRIKIDLTYAVQYRLFVDQTTSGYAGSDFNMQYSTDLINWFACDSGGAGEVDVGTGVGLKTGSWVNLVAGAQTDVVLRIVGKDGNGSIGPAFKQIRAQFKVTASSDFVNAQLPTYVVAAAGGDYTTIQGALDAATAGGTIYLTDSTYTIATALKIKGPNVRILGNGTTTIQCNGASVTTLFSINTTANTYNGFQLKDVTLVQTNATAQGIALDLSNISLAIVDNVEISDFGTALKLYDTIDNTFYNSYSNLKIWGCINGIDIGSASAHPVNDNCFYNCRTDIKAGGSGFGLRIRSGQGNTFYNHNCEPGTGAGLTGIVLAGIADGDVVNTTFHGVWVEGNFVGVNINSYTYRTTFYGGLIVGNTTNLLDSGNTTQYIGTDVGYLLMNQVAEMTAIGDFIVNTNQLFVDNLLSRVGIGITSPEFKLDVKPTIDTNGFRVGYDGTISSFEAYSLTDGSRIILRDSTSVSKVQLDAADNSWITGGNLGLGTVSPTALLHIKAGTTNANTAPLKLTAGINLLTPEAGAIEFDGTDITITTDDRYKFITTRNTVSDVVVTTPAVDETIVHNGTDWVNSRLVKITVSASEPVAPVVGDLWVDVS